MKKFSKILEKTTEQKKYKVQIFLEYEVLAANEGEASFLTDDFFKKIEGVSDISISKVELKKSDKDINI